MEMTTLNADDSIYYTTDGSDPSELSELYSGPISIDGTSVIRARVVKYNSVPGIINAATYLFNASHNLYI
jgi:hypothetical protein